MTVATVDDARELARRLIEREHSRHGGSLADARTRLARKMSVLPGTLYNLGRNRLKRLDAGLRDRLTAFAIRDLHQEIGRLQHELALARQVGADPCGARVREIEEHLARARALVDEAGEGSP